MSESVNNRWRFLDSMLVFSSGFFLLGVVAELMRRVGSPTFWLRICYFFEAVPTRVLQLTGAMPALLQWYEEDKMSRLAARVILSAVGLIVIGVIALASQAMQSGVRRLVELATRRA